MHVWEGKKASREPWSWSRLPEGKYKLQVFSEKVSA